jgi:nitroreductase
MLLDAARWAPSAGNVQPWEFVVVTAQKTKQALCKAAYNQKDLEEAPVVIVVCADEPLAEKAYGARGKMLYCLQDTAAAIQNLLLMACSLGLGSCWMGAFKEDEVARVVLAPKGMRVVALLPIGFPSESPPPRNRRSLGEIMHKETF